MLSGVADRELFRSSADSSMRLSRAHDTLALRFSDINQLLLTPNDLRHE